MTLTTHLRASVLFMMLAAVAFVTVASQVLTSFIVKALGDSQTLRIAPATDCQLASGGTHFTGCSSIL